jgi:predicted metal-dependent peptidase
VPGDLGFDDGRLAETYFGTPPAEPYTREWDCGSGADGQARPWDGNGEPGHGDAGLSAEQAERLRHTVAADVRRAHTTEPGTVPAGWLRWAESIAPSRTDWRRVLAAVIRRAVAASAGNVDYTYRKPSRRSHTVSTAERAILPSLFRPVIEVVIVCDTSGSMDDDALATVLAEVEAIIARAGLRAHGVAALAVDTEVHEARRVRRAAQVRLAGGGGTDMGAGISAALARRPRPDVIVVLTDGYTPWPEPPPSGVRVVVGLIEGYESAPPAPQWAIEVRIPQFDR